MERGPVGQLTQKTTPPMKIAAPGETRGRLRSRTIKALGAEPPGHHGTNVIASRCRTS